jgi:cystathionine gamma-synthase
VNEPEAPSARPRRPTFDPLPEWVAPATRLIHADRRPERNAGAVVFPIYQTSTFHYPAEFSEAQDGGSVYMYTRMSNPTLEGVAEVVRQLEGAEAARVYGSGMGALATPLFTFLRPGDEVIALEDLYGGSLDLLGELLPRFGVRVRFISHEAAGRPEELFSASTKMAIVESPTNPLLRVVDIARWARAADAAGALLLVDNTFATPINQNPIALGADLVLHSGTKYLGGHADLLAGAIAGPRGLLEKVDATHHVLGAVLDPFAAFLLLRGLRTLGVRVARQNSTGAGVAAALRNHPKVRSVFYPGAASPDEERIASLQMRGRGGMVSVVVAGGADGAQRFLRQLKLVHVASSLGSVESLASRPADTSHRHLSVKERERRGIDEGLVRLSLGLEEESDLVRDLTDALDRA